MLTASDERGVGLAGPALRDLPVESLTCKACARQTFTRDLPPIGIDVRAVLEQLAGVAPALEVEAGAPVCPCGARNLNWSTVVELTVHAVGDTMLGEVSSMSADIPTGRLSCRACSGSWDATHSDLPAPVREAFSAFAAALSRGDVGLED